MVAAVQPLDALDGDGIAAVATNIGAHGDQALGEIDDLRLAGGVFQNRGALRQRRRHQQILGASHGDGVEEDRRALQAAVTARADIARLDADLGAHRLEAANVQVHRPRANGTAAGQRYVGMPEVRQQRPQHQDRGAHLLDQVIGRVAILDLGAVELNGHALAHHRLDAHAPEQLQGGSNILQVRQVADGHRPLGEQRGAEDRQRRVLGATGPYFTIGGSVAAYNQFIHEYPLLRRRQRRRCSRRSATGWGYRS